MKHLLFVCTGNSCRSVMAQGYMQHLLDKAGVDSVVVESAGLFALHGMAASSETKRVLAEIDVDVSDHRARSLSRNMVENADVIFVMETFQREELIRRYPEAVEKVFLLRAYENPNEEYADIMDPIGKPMEVYETCFALIRESVGRIARMIGIHDV